VNNVRLAFPDMSEAAATRMARRSAQNFAMMFCEFMHLRTASPAEVRAYADIDGLEHIEQGLAAGAGSVAANRASGQLGSDGSTRRTGVPVNGYRAPTSNAGVEAHIAQVRAAANIGFISNSIRACRP
jgi:lauroyl/myristoyl acyltransferase